MNLQERDQKYIAHAYARYPVTFVRGAGAHVWDDAGKEYIDFATGYGVNSFGLCDPVWAEAVAAQAQKLSHVSNLFYTEPCVTLAEKLCARTGFRRVFFQNSGAEANECAMKAARKYSSDKYGEGRGVIVTLEHSFHGRTHATITATGSREYHTSFYPFPTGYVLVPPNDLDALEKALDRGDVCAFMFECVQGEGGVNTLEKDYLQAAEKLCRARDILLLDDEVQTGNGRTGTLYAFEQFGITPDLLTTAKGIGGGLPIGVAMFGAATADTLTPGTHGTTFGGNPIVCAGANTIIDRLDAAFLAEVTRKGILAREILLTMPHVQGVSGLGLMIGVTLDVDAAAVSKACVAAGLVAITAHEKLRVLPPLNISQADLEAGLQILHGVLAQ
ncbi:MAG: acetylornithine transaminase [Oscillospiraceae bacterium]|jgi:acetylornithine/N-succinyldiaminopimelate aminotransferase|nr:acetylornithine transaminase [Oscillospiraceae bacterium]